MINTNIVETNLGKIQGIEEERGYRFLGIPFAKAPFGKLTFKHPQPLDPWDGILKADTPKMNPIQRGGTFSIGNNSLDCLYLNVYVPKIAKEKDNLPVMVWVFGGSYATGGTGLENSKTMQIAYDSSDFANDTGCIIVTFNYRLNLYGYLNLNSLDQRFDVNNGIMDQVLALTFVKENIDRFGGDSNNITIFGQSAGGSSILALMVSKKANELFNKAIVMSPVSDHFYYPKESKKITKKYLNYLHIKKNNLDDLYNVKEEDIKKANKKIQDYLYRKRELRCPFSPTIDGDILEGEPKKMMINVEKPLLIGNVVNEGNLFLLDVPNFFLPFMVKLFGLKFKKKDGESYRHAASIELTNTLYLRPMMEFLNVYPGKVYKYEYRYESPDCKKLGVETFHACDVSVLFGYDMKYQKTSYDETKKITLKMRKLFSKFAHDDFDEFEDYKLNQKEIIIK